MKLEKKKKLAARTFGVGVDRIILVNPDEIKEAITRQDMIDLVKQGMIKIKEIKGRRKKEKRKTRRKAGSVKKKVNKRKKEYVKLTRKLRVYIKNLRKKEKINIKEYYDLRKNIKAKLYKSLSHLIEAIKEMRKSGDLK